MIGSLTSGSEEIGADLKFVRPVDWGFAESVYISMAFLITSSARWISFAVL